MEKVHFMGIGGSGASAAASIAITQGFEVTGCDTNINNEFTQNFDRSKLKEGHDPTHIQNTDILVITPAIPSLDPNNPEILRAKKRKIKVMIWQEFMGKYLQRDKFVIAVCGTHGKSTTTAMIGALLAEAGLDPTVELGAIVPNWGTNFRAGKSKYFVVEADEFNDNFLNYKPDISVVTNIEMDHPEYFEDFSAYKQSFKNFLLKTKKMIIANMEDGGVEDVIAIRQPAEKQSLEIDHHVVRQRRTPRDEERVVDYSKNLIDFPLRIPGKFNLINASAAYQVGVVLGIPEITIRKSLAGFKGIGRRFELLGDVNGAKIYSDFAHHPTEIRKTLNAAREKFPSQRIWVVYEPHMFSRTKILFDEFVKVFQDLLIDQTYIIDIYPSREKDTGLVSSKQLVEAIDKNNVRYVNKLNDLTEVLAKIIKDNDILFFMGAGDVDKTGREFVKKYAKSEGDFND